MLSLRSLEFAIAKDLASATNGFSADNRLGAGGVGAVRMPSFVTVFAHFSADQEALHLAMH